MSKKKELFNRIFFVLIGSFLNAIAINSFIIPHRLLSGGVAGVAIIIQYVANIPSGYLILAFNIPIFIYGMREVDKDFIIFSLIGTLTLSVFLVLTTGISEYLMVDDILLSSIYAGVIGGLGAGIVFRSRASMGGIDIIAVAIKRRSGINISTISLAINVVVVFIGLFINNIEIALYTLINMYVASVVINRVIDGFDRKKLLFIVTEKEKEVSNMIMKELGRGVTYFYGEGAYTGENKRVIYCIVTLNQLVKVKKMVEDLDPTSLMSVIDASEVQGKGFKKPAL
jgi:uncharacterized membrane-anchored protein YitT (DUF2179 family)